MNNQYDSRDWTEEEIVEKLQEAEEILGRTPKRREYQNDEIGVSKPKPSYYFIRKICGTWGNAKDAAGLETKGIDNPEWGDWSDEEWDDLGSDTQMYYIKRHKTNEVKSESGCQACGYNEDPVALEFHHKEGSDKKFNIASANTRDWDKILAEMDKCVIVCSNCHRRLEHTDYAPF